MTEPSRHLAPFHCPYCAEEQIRPYGEQVSTWRCEACQRVWTLRFVGIAPSATASTTSATAAVAAAERAEEGTRP